MPAVLCGFHAFEATSLGTAAAVARQFLATLGPAQAAVGAHAEVFRLQRLAPEAPLAPDELVLCRLPSLRLELQDVEELHRQLEDLQQEHQELRIQYERTREALVALDVSLDIAELEVLDGSRRRQEASVDGRRDAESRREVHLLKQQLAMSERQQQETKETVMGLRQEFMRFIGLWGGAGELERQALELLACDGDLLASTRSCWSPEVSASSRHAALEPGGRGAASCSPSGCLGRYPNRLGIPAVAAAASRKAGGSPLVSARSPPSVGRPQRLRDLGAARPRSGHSGPPPWCRRPAAELG